MPIKIKTIKDAEREINRLDAELKAVQEREPFNIQGLAEEISHLRKETHEGFSQLRRETREGFSQLRQEMQEKLDKNTLAIQSLETVMRGGFDNIGKVLQEISNKLSS